MRRYVRGGNAHARASVMRSVSTLPPRYACGTASTTPMTNARAPSGCWISILIS